MKVLVVDDNEFNIYTLRLMLKTFNIDCHDANQGKLAIEMIEISLKNNECDQCNGGYKLVFMDCNMPIMNGY